MRIAVLGIGRQGITCAIDLLREPDVQEVRLLDAERSRCETAAGQIQDARLRWDTVDASEEPALVEALKDCQVVISAVPYFLNLAVTRAAVRAGCSMTDMGGNTEIVFQQRALDEEAKQAGITVVPDLGLAPGLGNILAALAVQRFDEVEDVRIRCGGLPLDPQPPLGYNLTFSIYGLLNEYSGESVCLRNGEVTRIPTLTELEAIHFPDPVGRCEAVHTSGGTSTLPWTLEGRVRNLDYKTVRYPGHWQRIAVLKEIGLFETQPIRVGRTTLPPREIAAAFLEPALTREDARDVVVLRVSADGICSGERVRRQFDCLQIGGSSPGETAMGKMTAYPCAAVALEIARGQIKQKGVLAAEASVDGEGVIRHLRSRQIAVALTEATAHQTPSMEE
jgi:lysine 6-dehydrogenase